MRAGSEATILRRIIEPDRPELPSQVARLILRWKFSELDLKRMHMLLDKAKAGTLTRAEKTEAENYERVGHFLSILKSKARLSLSARRNGS